MNERKEYTWMSGEDFQEGTERGCEGGKNNHY